MSIDKKRLKREYKETPRPAGVYRVWNKVDDKSLVGSSLNLPGILNRHGFDLKLGNHRNRELQQDWNERGADAFEFEVLDTLEPSEDPNRNVADELKALEELWLERLQPFGERGYNERPK